MNLTHVVVWTAILGCVVYDVLCVAFGWQTISAYVRRVDLDSGMLFRWLWLALWLHWFAPNWTN